MIILASTSDKIQVITSAAVTVDVQASYVDWNGTAATPGRTNSAITTATTTDAVPAPGASTQRTLKRLAVKNKHASSSNTVTVQHTDGTTVVQMEKVTLAAGELLVIDEKGVGFVYDVNMAVKGATSIAVDPKTNDFRLSGVTATPVMTADSTTLSSIFLAQYKGNRIALNDGAGNWQLVAPPSEVSLAVTGRTTDLPFDIFAFNNAGTVTLELTDWSTATARVTGLSRVDGVWTKTGDATRRYLGSCRPRSATTFHWVMAGTDAPAKFDLFNADNRVRFIATNKATTDTWTYTTATIRQAQASTNYQADVMVGLQEEICDAELIVTSSNSTISIERETGIGLDSTTAFSGLVGACVNTVASIMVCSVAKFATQLAIGRHFLAWLEISTATGTCTFYGDNAGARLQSGMTISWSC